MLKESRSEPDVFAIAGKGYGQAISEMMHSRADPKKVLGLSVSILEIDEKIPSLSQSFPKITEKNFNGVNFRDIVEEADSKTMATMMLRFVTGIPTDDAVWKTFVENVIFAFPIGLDPRAIEIKNLPLLLRTQAQPNNDPITGDEVFTRNWVTSFMTPRPTIHELASPQKMYVNEYQTRDTGIIRFVDDYWQYKYVKTYLKSEEK